jgi:hypothetical protein
MSTPAQLDEGFGHQSIANYKYILEVLEVSFLPELVRSTCGGLLWLLACISELGSKGILGPPSSLGCCNKLVGSKKQVELKNWAASRRLSGYLLRQE